MTIRYNMFYLVHKGLKALLHETAMEIQHTDFWNVEQGDAIVKMIREAVTLFEKHAATEDRFVLPAIGKYEPGVVDAFEQDHEKDHQLGEELLKSAVHYSNAAVLTDKAAAGRELQVSYLKFMVFNLDHMMREEDILNKIFWRYYTDDELKSITQEIVASIPPESMAVFGKWMIRGWNTPEITAWLKGVEQSAPDVVFKGMLANVEKEIPRKRFRDVMDGLSIAAVS